MNRLNELENTLVTGNQQILTSQYGRIKELETKNNSLQSELSRMKEIDIENKRLKLRLQELQTENKLLKSKLTASEQSKIQLSQSSDKAITHLREIIKDYQALFNKSTN